MSTDLEEIANRVRQGDRPAIARAISLMERGDESARQLSSLLFAHTGNAYIVGITGAPGAGKSTLTDRLIAQARHDGDSIGVLAIDPTSPFTGGAILGDRVRMQEHATDPDVFIRSMATRGHLGGLAIAAPLATRVLDAAGFPWIVVETVGVGQVEVEIVGAADTTVVVVTPGWGDGVQANKAGLMEIADIFVVNKADRPGVRETVRDLEQMLDLADHDDDGWRPTIIETTATEDHGVDKLWRAIADHRSYLVSSGQLDARRRQRVQRELRAIIHDHVARAADERCSGDHFTELVSAVMLRQLDPYAAARQLLA